MSSVRSNELSQRRYHYHVFLSRFKLEIMEIVFPAQNGAKPSIQFRWNPKVFDLPAMRSRWQCNSISRPLSAARTQQLFPWCCHLLHPVRDEGGTDLRMSRTIITQLERHGCRQIYGPYHGAASKRLFAVKRKRLTKTSLYNRVNTGLVFGPW